MSTDTTILLSIKLDTGDLKKNAETASEKLLDLKKRQSELDKTTKEGALAYAKLGAEIKAQNLVLNQSSKALEINERLGHKQNLSLKEQGELLSAGKVALRNLTAEQIANTESGQQLNKEVNDLNESLKKSEAGYGVHVREVGNYDKGIRGLKAELKDLKSIMVGLDAGSKEYQQASEKAGVLGDKIKEVNENVKASSGGTGFEKLSNNLGLVKDDLMNLDFAGVSEKMKQMAVVSKGMTFKEVIGGVKNMGSALLSLGEAILMNPMFIMVGVIVGVVAALKMWSDYSAEQAVKAQEKHTKSLERNIETIKTQQKTLERSQELELKRAELEGKNAKELGKIKLRHLSETNKKQIEEQKAFNKLSNDLAEQIKIAERQGNEEIKNDLEDKKQDAEKSFIDLFNENQLYEDKRTNLIIETNNAIRDENNTNNEKILADNKKAEDERLALAYKIKDLILDNEDLKNENQSKIIEAHYKFLEDSAAGNVDQLLKIQEEKNNKLTQLDLDIYNDAISRQEENYKREQKDANGNATILAQLKINNQTEIDKINIEFDNKQKERENKQLTDAENINKAKVEVSRNTANEIKQIDSDLNILKATTEAEQLKAFTENQAIRIEILKSNAEAEIALGADKTLKLKQLDLDVAKVQSETFTAKKDEIIKNNEWKLTAEQEQNVKYANITINAGEELYSTLNQIKQNQIAQELIDEQNKNDVKQTQLQSQLDAGLISQSDFNSKKSDLDAKYAAQQSSLKRKAFEQEKQANIVKALMGVALGVVNSLATAPPLGYILAGITAALGAVQVAAIASQPTPKFAKGGVFGGNSHANGGTKGVFSDGTQIEVERDENFYILNKNASRHINGLSNLNQQFGGIPLMANGGAVTSSGIMASNITNGVDANLNAQNQLIRMIEMMPKPVVIVQDINDAQGNLATVENRANF